MKLIDLLVQELPKRGGWPDGVAALVQEDEKDLHGCESEDLAYRGGLGWYSDSDWIVTGDDRIILGELADDYKTAIITREQYEAALAAAQPQWDGQGLPPVGCEFEHSFHADNFSTWHWRKCTATGKHGVLCVDKNDTELYLNDTNNKFRPIRSEADKKRDEAVEAMVSHKDNPVPPGENYYHAIYDAIAAGKIPGIRIE